MQLQMRIWLKEVDLMRFGGFSGSGGSDRFSART